MQYYEKHNISKRYVNEADKRECIYCRIVKVNSEFSISKKDGRRATICKKCKCAYAKEKKTLQKELREDPSL